MPGSLPKADYQIYADQLATLRYGSALWDPEPHFQPVQVGDVGYIRDGGFHLLFNAAAPSGESGLDFPADLPILDVGRVTKRRRAPGAQKSAHITAFGAQAEMALENVPMNVLRAGGGFVVESQVREGAILLTKYDTVCENTQLLGRFRSFILKHHKSWAQFANDSGHGIGPEDILLVTGRDMTADHTMLAFSQNDQRREMQLEVGISDIASASARWGRLSCQFPVLFRNQGPLRRIEPTSQEIAGTEEPERTQCVFLRAYRVYHRALFFRKVIQAGAGPHNPGPGQRFDDMGVSLFAAQDEDQFTDDGDDLVAITNVPKFRDPLEALARYLLENSSAELAVVHDDDLIPLKTEEPLSDLAIDEVAELVSRCALEVCTEDIEGLKVAYVGTSLALASPVTSSIAPTALASAGEVALESPDMSKRVWTAPHQPYRDFPTLNYPGATVYPGSAHQDATNSRSASTPSGQAYSAHGSMSPPHPSLQQQADSHYVGQYQQAVYPATGYAEWHPESGAVMPPNPRLPPSSASSQVSASSSHRSPSPPSPGERFPCDKCDKCFARADARKRHYETRHYSLSPLHQCPFCKQIFSRGDSLKRHRRRGCEKDPSFAGGPSLTAAS